MDDKATTRLDRIVGTAALALALAVLLGAGTALAGTQYLGNGATQNASSGGWDLPNKGSCYPDATQATRPECLALRFPSYTAKSACIAGTAPNVNSWSMGVCNDTVNTTQSACTAAPGRLWSNGVCAVTMKGYDRNAVQCTNLGGTWITSGTCTGTWVMPDASTYSPALLTAVGPNPGTGDQCLRCHRSDTQYNSVRGRDVDSFLKTGHQNMSRPVVPGKPWAGPNGVYASGSVLYPNYSSKTGTFDWVNGLFTPAGGVASQLLWIFDGWFEYPSSPYAIYNAGNGGMAYSCSRCHTTGYTTDSGTAPNTAKNPEKTFPGLGVTWNGTTGLVKLASGVAGDTNVMASWDQWGIQCTRCHSSAVNNTGGALPYTAPSGMKTHHSYLTNADYPGWCSGANAYDAVSCAAAGGTWNYGYCSDSRFSTQADCTNTANYWPNAGYPGAPVGQWFTPCSDNTSTNQTACLAITGNSWNSPSSSCSVSGVCSKSQYTNQTTCTANAGTWTALTITDIDSCKDAGGKYTGSFPVRGQRITALCMTCHRQETSGWPVTYGACSGYTGTTVPADQGTCLNKSGTWTESAAQGVPLQVGNSHGAIGFTGHSHANQFLNGAMAQYTGTFAQIGTAPYSATQGPGVYQSGFLTDDDFAANTGNGCTGCHDVHKSVNTAANPAGGAVKECVSCHEDHSFATVQHPNVLTCTTCHMPNGQHLFGVNTDPTYSTFAPSAWSGTATVDAALAPPAGSNYGKVVVGTKPPTVYNDLNMTCGQCHGAGSSNLATTGTIATGALSTLNVNDATGVVVGDAISIVGAGASGATLVTHVAAVTGTTITLTNAATTTVSGAAVNLNPTSNGAPYFSKNTLSIKAQGMHQGSVVGLTATFSYARDAANPNKITFDASKSTCSNAGGCYASWVFGDGNTSNGGPSNPDTTATNTYAAAGNYVVVLTMTDASGNVSKFTQRVTAWTINPKPVDGTPASGCTWNANSWQMSCANTYTSSTLTIAQVVVNWGDGTPLYKQGIGPTGTDAVGAPIPNHTYKVAGAYKVTLTVVDSKGQTAGGVLATTQTTNATAAFYLGYFSVSGTVTDATGTAIPSAPIKIYSGSSVATGTPIMNSFADASGNFTIVHLKPGVYTLSATAPGHAAPGTLTTPVLGPSVTGQTITVN